MVAVIGVVASCGRLGGRLVKSQMASATMVLFLSLSYFHFFRPHLCTLNPDGRIPKSLHGHDSVTHSNSQLYFYPLFCLSSPRSSLRSPYPSSNRRFLSSSFSLTSTILEELLHLGFVCGQSLSSIYIYLSPSTSSRLLLSRPT